MMVPTYPQKYIDDSSNPTPPTFPHNPQRRSPRRARRRRRRQGRINAPRKRSWRAGLCCPRRPRWVGPFFSACSFGGVPFNVCGVVVVDRIDRMQLLYSSPVISLDYAHIKLRPSSASRHCFTSSSASGSGSGGSPSSRPPPPRLQHQQQGQRRRRRNKGRVVIVGRGRRHARLQERKGGRSRRPRARRPRRARSRKGRRGRGSEVKGKGQSCVHERNKVIATNSFDNVHGSAPFGFLLCVAEHAAS